MKIFYAGGARYVDVNTGKMIGLGYDLMKNHLTAWIDKSEMEIRERYLKEDCHFIADSGAFTAYTKGKEISLEEYRDFMFEYIEKYKDRLLSLNFINLDKIGDAEESWKNQSRLEKMGLNPMPVVHQYGFKVKYLEKAYSEYDYFAFGGMWGRSRKKDTIPWLNFCYQKIMKWVKKGNKLPKVHFLGIGSDRILMRFPAYSCDNTKWMSVNKYGKSLYCKDLVIPKAGQRHIKSYKNESKYEYDKAKDQLLLAKIVENELRMYKKREEEITEFWKQRGIDYDV